MKTKGGRLPQKGEQAILLPGPTGAEPWEAWILGGPDGAECVQVCATPADNPLRKNAALALPVAKVHCQPLWLNETDAKQFPGMIHLQLELRGLLPRGNGAPVFDWSVAAQEGPRTLVTVGILPASLSQEVQVDAYAVFDLSARYFSFPENAMTFWHEQDRLAVAVTRGKNLVYFQALAEATLTSRVLQDLICIRAVLIMQNISPHLGQAVFWSRVDRSELTALQTTLQLSVQQADRPPPQAPPTAWELTPPSVGAAKKNREIWRWRNRGILAALVLYLLVVVIMLSRLWLTSYKVDQLQKWQARHADEVALVRKTKAAWQQLNPVVDEKSYPLELLLNCAEDVPADQLHLTLFEVNNGHLLINGEAKNVTAAFQFRDHLKRDPHFAGYNWEMGQPKILPNDLTQLQIEGTRAVSN
jgi:hypothetical protein